MRQIVMLYVLALMAGTATAQERASIVGQVVDSTGAVMPGVTVEASGGWVCAPADRARATSSTTTPGASPRRICVSISLHWRRGPTACTPTRLPRWGPRPAAN